MNLIKPTGDKTLALLLLSFLLLVLASGQLFAAGKPYHWLSANELEKLFANKTVTAFSEKYQRTSVTYYSTEGRVTQSREGKIRHGVWHVEPRKQGGRICLAMEGKKMKCRAIAYDGERYKKYIVKKNGEHRHVITYLKFEPRNRVGKG